MFADAMTKELKERMPVRLGYSNNFNSGVRGVNWPVVSSIWWNNPVIKLMTAEEFKDYECQARRSLKAKLNWVPTLLTREVVETR